MLRHTRISRTSCLFLLTQKRRSGLMLLLRPTKKGHGALYLRKFAVMTAAVLLGFLLICGVDLAIAVHLFGIGDLSRPIQSAYGFQDCLIPLTVLGYLMTYFARKLLWGLAVCMLFFTVCGVVSNVSSVLLTAVGFLAAALGMGMSGIHLNHESIVCAGISKTSFAQHGIIIKGF